MYDQALRDKPRLSPKRGISEEQQKNQNQTAAVKLIKLLSYYVETTCLLGGPKGTVTD